MAVKNRRFLLYILADTGADGRISQGYVLQPSDATDFGYWGGRSFISSRETTVGAQGEHVVMYDITLSDTVPLANTDDALLVLLPANVIHKVLAVSTLDNTGEKQARCLDVSDAASTYTLTT